MPVRRQPGSNPKRETPQRNEQARPVPDSTALVARLFTPAVLNLDDLAEAIRVLLADDGRSASSRPDPDLLSAGQRVSHVVEANRTP